VVATLTGMGKTAVTAMGARDFSLVAGGGSGGGAPAAGGAGRLPMLLPPPRGAGFSGAGGGGPVGLRGAHRARGVLARRRVAPGGGQVVGEPTPPPASDT